MQTRVPKEKDGLMLSQFLIQTAGDVPMWAIKEAMKKRDVRIDGVRIAGGYVWGTYVGASSGQRRYVALGPTSIAGV